MPEQREPCWYCRRAWATMWCDFRLGAVLDAKQLALGETARSPAEVVETCDVAACYACAKRFGWKPVMAGIVCSRGRGGSGCKSFSVDHCHLHAASESRGTTAWLGSAGVSFARAEARAACVRIYGGTGTA